MDWLTSANIVRNLKALTPSQVVPIIGFVLLLGFTIFVSLGPTTTIHSSSLSVKECEIPAIYNFGDSNSDTGSVSAAFGRVPFPNGASFFGKSTGRYCDGRLMIDFMAEKLGLPYLSAYLDSITANFQHGADFAASGSSIQKVDGKLCESGLNPLSLDVQLLQFTDLKERTSELQDDPTVKGRLPRVEDFSKALYTLDIGQNDIHNALVTTTEELALKSIPELVNHFTLAIKKLYDHGARRFWVHNTGPIGCMPYLLVKSPPKPGNVDETGCIKSYNEVAREFNRQQKNRISGLRTQLQDSLLVYVDIYTAKYNLISEAKKHGFIDPLGYCCKHQGNSRLHCWNQKMVNGSVIYTTPCSNPSEYISWDSIHYSEAANRWITDRIMDGSLSDPPVSLTGLCRFSV